MTDKQYKMMDVIATHFLNKSFYFNELKQYGEFYPATLTSLVGLGYVVKKEDSKGKKIYQYIEPDLSEEDAKVNKQRMELESQINQAKGVLDHLNSSKANWIRTTESLGIEFPEEEFNAWADKIYKQTEDYLFSKQELLSIIIESKSAF